MTSIIKADNISTVSGSGNITIPTGVKVIGTDAGSIAAPGQVLQTINDTTNAEFSFTTAGSWVNTGLFSMTFANALQSSSKVLVRVYATLGEAQHNTWGAATAITIFENSTNKGDDTWGIANANAQMTGDANYTQYECNRLVGEILFTPSVTNGTYTLYAKQHGAGTKVIGGVVNTGASVPQGASQVTLMEIAQ